VSDDDRLLTRDFILGFLGLLLAATSHVFFLPVLPLRITDLGGTARAVGVAMSAFPAGSMLIGLLGAGLIQAVGRRWAMMAGLALLAVVPGLFAAASSSPLITVGRLAQGVGWGIFMIASLQFISRTAPRRRPATAIGFFTLAPYLAIALGPALAEAARHHLSFGRLMLLPSTVAVVAAVASVSMQDSGAPRAAESVVDVRAHLRDLADAMARSVVLGPIACFTGNLFLLGTLLFFLPLFAGRRTGGSSSLFFAVLAMSILLSRFTFSRLADSLESRTMVSASAGLMISGAGLVTLASDPFLLGIAAVPCGLGFAALYPTFNVHFLRFLPPHRVGIAVGLLAASADLGLGMGGMVCGPVVDRFGFGSAILLATALATLATAFFALVPAQPRQGGSYAPG
jgi:predicted MFS family arabinose efflux permease